MMLNMDFVLRLLVAGILGAIIGLDREYRAKEAGYRTHFLVSLGSALIMIVSQYGFQEIIKENSVSLDPSRVAATSSQRHRFHRRGNHYLSETDSPRTDYRRRYLGYRRNRTGSRRRNVHYRHCRHGIDTRRLGTTQLPIQKHRNEKFNGILLYRQQEHTETNCRQIQLQRLPDSILRNGDIAFGRIGILSSDNGYQVQTQQ